MHTVKQLAAYPPNGSGSICWGGMLAKRLVKQNIFLDFHLHSVGLGEGESFGAKKGKRFVQGRRA